MVTKAQLPTKRKRREYAPTEIDQALTVVAYYGGNCARASEELGIPKQTLHDWRTADHRDRYREIAEREAPKLEAIAAQQAREVILRAADVEHNILDRLADDTLSTKELAEAAGALQRTTTAKGINTTKLLELTGRPTQIIEHRDPREDLRGLARDLGLSIPGTATEIRPNEALPAVSGLANARELRPAERAAD